MKVKFHVESQSSIGGSRHKPAVDSPPASLQDWLDEELERRGIDAVIYTRYILSILLQDCYDGDSCVHGTLDEDISSYYFCNDRRLKNQPQCNARANSGTSKKSTDGSAHSQRQLGGDHEQRKKSAAVECLKSVSDEKYGIEELVEDLCAKLKEFQLERENERVIKRRAPSNQVASVNPSFEEQAEKYYAAFPALSATSTNSLLKLSISTENSGMVIEKSAWTPGHQLLFDCEISASPEEVPPPKSKPTFIVPKLKLSKSKFSPSFLKNEPQFRINRLESNAADDDSTSEDCPILVPQNEPGKDDELLANFISKFNGNNISSIWDKMLQPRIFDTMIYSLPKEAGACLLGPVDQRPNCLTAWSSYERQDWSYTNITQFTSRCIESCMSSVTSQADDPAVFYEAEDDVANPDHCLLPSEQTHFRPIRQESLEFPEKPADLISPLSATSESKIDPDTDTESESRGSWSPDMKDCFQPAAVWPSFPTSSETYSPNIPSTTPSVTLDHSPCVETEHQVVGSSKQLSEIFKTPLKVDVGPWNQEEMALNNFVPCEKTAGDGGIFDDYGAWKYDSPWSPLSLWHRLIDLPSENEPGSDGVETPAKDQCSVIVKNEDLEALKVEIKEETEQLFDDIQDILNKEDFVDKNFNNETLCEWMRDMGLGDECLAPNVNLLPHLETKMVDEFLGQVSGSKVVQDDLLYSSELEAEWIKDSQNFNVQIPKLKEKTTKSGRRPCSFFLEGTCRRSDCKFSHDLSTITCRFWEDGCCFKGITCPFLHGYRQLSSEESDLEHGNTPDLASNHELDFSTLLVADPQPNEHNCEKPDSKLSPNKLKRKRKKNSHRNT